MNLTRFLLCMASWLLLSGCASTDPSGLSSRERRELLTLTSAKFIIPAGRETEVFGILAAVRDQHPTDLKVASIDFDPMRGTTVYFEAPPRSFHGGPFAKATRDGANWLIEELWTLQ